MDSRATQTPDCTHAHVASCTGNPGRDASANLLRCFCFCSVLQQRKRIKPLSPSLRDGGPGCSMCWCFSVGVAAAANSTDDGPSALTGCPPAYTFEQRMALPPPSLFSLAEIGRARSAGSQEAPAAFFRKSPPKTSQTTTVQGNKPCATQNTDKRTFAHPRNWSIALRVGSSVVQDTSEALPHAGARWHRPGHALPRRRLRRRRDTWLLHQLHSRPPLHVIRRARPGFCSARFGPLHAPRVE